MKSEPSFRLFQNGDEKEIINLLKLVFDGWPNFDIGCTPTEHWSWKYLENVFEKNFISISVVDGRIVGVNHALPVRIKIGDEVTSCAYAADTVVHPLYRGRGLFNKMTEVKNSSIESFGINLAFSVTRNPILLKKYSRSSSLSLFPHEITNLVRIKDIGLQLKMMPVKNAGLMRLAFHAYKLMNGFRNAFLNFQSGLEHDLPIKRVFCFDRSIDAFWQKVEKHYDFILEKRVNYLNWRYCNPRAGVFIVRQAEDDNGVVLGYSVLRINRHRKDYALGYLIDLLAIPGRIDVAEALVADGISYFESNDINIVNCLIPKGHPYEKIFRKYGFLDSRIKLNLWYRMIKGANEIESIVASPPAKIHFSYGDIDSLPVDMSL